MVNFGLNSAAILGIFLAVAGVGLYFVRSIRPELSRDYDIFFAAVGLLCGLILLFNGWRLDPILQFGQFLLTGTAIFFAVEAVRLRGATVEQAKRNTPIVEKRPVSKTRVYTEAELDRLEPYEEEDYSEGKRRSLRGSEEARSSRTSSYETEEPRSQRSRRSSERYDEYREASRKRRPRPTAEPTSSHYDVWEDTQENWEEKPQATRPRRPRRESDVSQSYSAPPRKRRPRPSDLGGTPYEDTESIPTDYVDYQPIDESERERPDWERESAQSRSEREPERELRNTSEGIRNSRGTDLGESYSDEEVENRDNPMRFDY
ncbi:MAG: Ycf66 family protein [Hydrococcus sp. C42_A2020_068]|uniref:Ycf66 family protein n=1 Tax=Pleurocapsa sp. PCC 7327 TaxID=118163 RepID=UPI00029FEAF0|nr:Ycf66 family protein [Pleurocapsa sp. PCC 7327]AFY76206.1 chloride channel protein EriC [Pleurocapsa sp. PCC 7327]MBF2018982.1 Ycf66 family protein [Hydrococcus sp. C42_A2020_068]